LFAIERLKTLVKACAVAATFSAVGFSFTELAESTFKSEVLASGFLQKSAAPDADDSPLVQLAAKPDTADDNAAPPDELPSLASPAATIRFSVRAPTSIGSKASQYAAVRVPLLQNDVPTTAKPLLHVGWQVSPDSKSLVQVPTLPFDGAVLASQGSSTPDVLVDVVMLIVEVVSVVYSTVLVAI
jgi:hypothetical protein